MPHLPPSLFVLMGLIAVVALVAIFLRHYPHDSDITYRKHSPMFSAAERSFLGVLDVSVGNEFRVFGKVREADVLTPAQLVSRGAWQIAFNKISAKHFDFVVCHAHDLSVACVVELDDRSHQKRTSNARSISRANLSADRIALASFPRKSRFRHRYCHGGILKANSGVCATTSVLVAARKANAKMKRENAIVNQNIIDAILNKQRFAPSLGGEA